MNGRILKWESNGGIKLWRHGAGRASSPEVIILFNVKIMKLHEVLLLGAETDLVEAFKGRFF